MRDKRWEEVWAEIFDRATYEDATDFDKQLLEFRLVVHYNDLYYDRVRLVQKTALEQFVSGPNALFKLVWDQLIELIDEAMEAHDA